MVRTTLYEFYLGVAGEGGSIGQSDQCSGSWKPPHGDGGWLSSPMLRELIQRFSRKSVHEERDRAISGSIHFETARSLSSGAHSLRPDSAPPRDEVLLESSMVRARQTPQRLEQ